MSKRRLQTHDYTVGWVCALPIEFAAAQAMLDEEDDDPPQHGSISDLYKFGRIGHHNTVIACLPAGQMGTQSAAAVAARMTTRFTSIRFGLMVGIGGGVPSIEQDLRLGDVVISQPRLQHGGVVQYDFGKTGAGGQKTRTGWLNAPPKVLLNAVSSLQALRYLGKDSLAKNLSAFDRLETFNRDASGPDILFESSYNHIGGATCDQCNKEKEIGRTPRKNQEVVVHYGTIASGNQVIKDGITRDRISADLGGVKCFEMEAAGLMNEFPCLVIRGICDYADSHKNKRWQPYAAATAAACAKEILSIAPAAAGDAHYCQQQSEQFPSPCSTVPFRHDTDFIERGALMHQICTKLSAPAARAALVGLGGVGKSQLAIEYCHQIRKQSPRTWVFWVHSSNLVRLEQGFRDIADATEIPGREDPKADVFQLVSRRLRDGSKGSWTVVLDNADDATILSKVSACLPQSPHGSVLVTSRSKRAALGLVEESEIISIDPMQQGDAIALLEKKLGTESSHTELVELAKALECMPLAIVQAAAYITQRAPRYSVQRYLVDFNKGDRRKTSLLAHEAGQLRRDAEAKNSILVTWQISFDYIQETRKSAADLLSLMSFFDRQGIPESLLQSENEQSERGDDAHRVEEVDFEGDTVDDASSELSYGFEDDVIMLRDFSLILVGVDSSIFEMHRLVQLATRTWLDKCGQSERYRRRFIRNLCAVYPTGSSENWTECQTLFPHAKAAEALQPRDEGMAEEWAAILRNAAWYAWAKGSYNEAERIALKATKVLSKVCGEENIQMLDCMEMLGLVYSDKGRWNEAEKLEVQVMETRKRVLGDEHPDTLTGMANLASTYRNQGRWNEAEELDVQVMETSARVLGDEHPDTLTSMNNLAFIWKEQGRDEDAIKLMKECVQLGRRILGTGHPHYISSSTTLAGWEAEQADIGSLTLENQ